MFNPWANLSPTDPLSMWNAAPPATAPSMQPVYAQMYELGNAFRSICESMQGQTPSTINPQQLEQMVRQFSFNPVLQTFPQAPALGQVNNPWGQFFDSGKAFQNWNLQTGQPPALGIGREFQEDWSKWVQLNQEYDSATRAFMDIFQSFVRNAIERFMQSVSGIEEAVEFEAVVRDWIDCCDNEFQQVASQPEYAGKYGRMINSYLRLLQHSNKMQEQFQTMQGQPTRTELDRLHQALKQARTEIDTLQEKVRELATPSKQARPAPAKRTTRKTTATGKTRSRKPRQ